MRDRVEPHVTGGKQYANPEAEAYRLAVEEYRKACESQNPPAMARTVRDLSAAWQDLRRASRRLSNDDAAASL